MQPPWKKPLVNRIRGGVHVRRAPAGTRPAPCSGAPGMPRRRRIDIRRRLDWVPWEGSGLGVLRTRQPISSNTLKIGMYKAMIIDPTMPPRKAIISGSMSAVSASVVASTSSS